MRITVRMSLVKIPEEETDNCDPPKVLEGQNESSRRGRDEELEEFEEWNREGREARVCYPGMGVNKLAGEEMMEGMARVRKNRMKRGLSIMKEVSMVEERDEVSVVEKTEENKHCCVCQ